MNNEVTKFLREYMVGSDGNFIPIERYYQSETGVWYYKIMFNGHTGFIKVIVEGRIVSLTTKEMYYEHRNKYSRIYNNENKRVWVVQKR